MNEAWVLKLADAVSSRLIGQCVIDLDQATEEEGDRLNIPVETRQSASYLAAVDSLCFCCDGCGWWCSTEELHNETDQNLCDDCEEE